MITVTGEDVEGEQKLYDKPQIAKFTVIKYEDEILLEIVKDGGANNSNTVNLRLTKK
jgi:hypothetical protein